MKRMTARKGFLAVLVFTMLICPVYAGVPQIINYEGTLTDTSGNPIPDGTYEIQFGIYNAQSGGTPIWTERWDSTTTPVAVYKGKFNVLLGTHNRDTLLEILNNLSEPVAYIGVKVGTDAEMAPRQRLASVVYAFSSGYASTAAQASSATYANSAGSATTAVGVVPAGGIIMWSGSAANIPAGWALCDGQNGTPDLRDKFIVGAGGSYPVGGQGGTVTNNFSHNHVVDNHAHHIDVQFYNCIGDCVDSRDKGNQDTGSDTHGHHLIADTWPAAPGTNYQLGTAVENRPPYYALCFIMKKP